MVKYRVARGLEETWGRDRNSSRSIVPELSCMYDEQGQQRMNSMKLYGLYLIS